MSKVYTDTVTSTEASQDLTLGGSGDNVIVTAGATLKTNTVKDSGGNTLWTSDGSGNLSSVNAAMKGNMVLLSTQTASNAASVSFTSDIDNTYRLYIFKFLDINPATDGTSLGFQANAVGASGYNETMTTTYFQSYHSEDDTQSAGAISYDTGQDQAQGTSFQKLSSASVGSGGDESCAGELFLFNPSNTTYVKHFYSRASNHHQEGYAQDANAAGYINITAAIDEISFKMESGNISSGTIKMWGVK